MKRETIADIHFIEDSEDEVFISRLLLKSQNVDVNVVHYPSYDSGKFPHVVSGICTGSEDPADRLSAEKVGARFFIQKPLDLNALKSVCVVVDELEIVTTGAVLCLQSLGSEA
jgi:hypothetical protein